MTIKAIANYDLAPPKIPTPRSVTLQVTWNEFLILHALLAGTSASEDREKVARTARSEGFMGLRPISEVEGSPDADAIDLYEAMHKIFLGKDFVPC